MQYFIHQDDAEETIVKLSEGVFNTKAAFLCVEIATSDWKVVYTPPDGPETEAFLTLQKKLPAEPSSDNPIDTSVIRLRVLLEAALKGVPIF